MEQLLKEVYINQEAHKAALKSFRETYEGLQVGIYSDDILKEIIESGTGKIAKQFKENASKQLDKSGITSPLLKANLLKGCDEVLEMFNQSIDGLQQSATNHKKKLVFDASTKNQMKVAFMGIVGNSRSFGNDNVKRLELGNGLGFTTQCGKNYDLMPCKIEVKHTDDTYYIYAKLSRETEKAVLTVSTTPQSNTNEDFFILWQTGTFNLIKI